MASYFLNSIKKVILKTPGIKQIKNKYQSFHNEQYEKSLFEKNIKDYLDELNQLVNEINLYNLSKFNNESLTTDIEDAINISQSLLAVAKAKWTADVSMQFYNKMLFLKSLDEVKVLVTELGLYVKQLEDIKIKISGNEKSFSEISDGIGSLEKKEIKLVETKLERIFKSIKKIDEKFVVMNKIHNEDLNQDFLNKDTKTKFTEIITNKTTLINKIDNYVINLNIFNEKDFKKFKKSN